MDEIYKKYISKQTVDKWSLIDYDSWLIINFDHNQSTCQKSQEVLCNFNRYADMLINDNSSRKTTKAKFLLKNKKSE